MSQRAPGTRHLKHCTRDKRRIKRGSMKKRQLLHVFASGTKSIVPLALHCLFSSLGMPSATDNAKNMYAAVHGNTCRYFTLSLRAFAPFSRLSSLPLSLSLSLHLVLFVLSCSLYPFALLLSLSVCCLVL